METDERLPPQGDLHTQQINTEGGTAITGNIETGGGDFVGRDKNIYIGSIKIPKPLMIWITIAISVGMLLLVVILIISNQTRRNTGNTAQKAATIDAKLDSQTYPTSTTIPTSTPAPMSDSPNSFNVAISQFGDPSDFNNKVSQTSIKMSHALFAYLKSEFGGIDDVSLDIEIAHSNIGVITEEKQAEELADRIHADIIIYGTIVINGNEAELYPSFWVRNQADTEELTGQHRFDLPIPFEVDQLLSTENINVILRTRAIALVAITKGLVYLKFEKTEKSIQSFTQAQQALESLQQCQPLQFQKGCELVHLLMGVAYSQNKDGSNAQLSFQKALIINPEYSRAYIGLGNIYYAQAIQDWSKPALLETSLDYYQKALTAKDAPQGNFVLEKVKVSIGNIYVIYAQQANDENYFQLAVQNYNEVINTFLKAPDETRERLRNIAATAYFGLGAAYERQLRIDEAKVAYSRCAEITDNLELQRRAKEHIDGITAEG